MILAIFDLDDTLTYQDTETLWMNFLVKNQYLDREYVLKRQEKFCKDYQNGCLNFKDVIGLSLKPMISLTLEQQQHLQTKFKEQVLKKYILPQGQKLIKEHRARGDTVLVISAGHEFLIRPAMSFFQAHDFICTRLRKEAQSGRYLPHLNGPAVFREQKVIEYKKWLDKQSQSFKRTYFYSDSINDLPLFDCVDIPIAVNPCPKLQVHAQTNKWQVLNFKESFIVEHSTL